MTLLVLCGCLFAILAKFGRQVDFSDEIIVYVDALDSMAAGFVGSVDHKLTYKLSQERGGQLHRVSIR